MTEGKTLVNLAVDIMISCGVLAFIIGAIAFVQVLYNYKANEDIAKQERATYSEWAAYNGTVISGVEVLDLITKNVGTHFVLVYDTNAPTTAYIAAGEHKLIGTDYYEQIVLNNTNAPISNGQTLNQVFASSMYTYDEKSGEHLMSELQDNLLTAKADTYADYECTLVLTDSKEIAGVVCRQVP